MSALIILGLIYFFANPSLSAWMPKCPVHLLTGYQCPGCGFQRALHALLHGNVREAISYNLFLLIAIPYLLIAMVCSVAEGKTIDWMRKNLLSKYTAYAYVALYFIWWGVRNVIHM